MKNFIITACLIIAGSAQLKAQPVPEMTSQDVCETTVSFLNELVVSNFNNYMGEELPSLTGGKYKTYSSAMPYTGSMLTIIEDTNSTSTYRGAKIIFYEQQRPVKEMSPEMINLYKRVTTVLDDCLANNGFLIPEPEPGQTRGYESVYILPWASDYNKVITTSKITVTTRVIVRHSEGGKKYNHRFEILIARN